MPETEELEVDHNDPMAQGIRAIAEGALAQSEPVTFEPPNDVVTLLWLEAEPDGVEVHGVGQRSATVNEEVVQRRPLSTQSGQRNLVLAAAAVIVVATAGLATWRTLDGAGDRTELGHATTAATSDEHQDPSRTTNSIETHLPALPPPYVAATYTTLADPYVIDLRATVESAGQRRLTATSGEITTVDVTQLPDGWEVDVEEAYIDNWSNNPGWTYTHSYLLTGPDNLEASLHVEGVWTGSIDPFSPDPGDIHDPFWENFSSISEVWQPVEQIRVALVISVTRSNSNTASEDEQLAAAGLQMSGALRELQAAMNELIEQPLPVSTERIAIGTNRPIDALLAGRSPGELHWAVLRRDPETKPLLRIGSQANELPFVIPTMTSPSRWMPAERDLAFTAGAVPGGHVLFGEAPIGTDAIWLMVETVDATLEVVGIPVASGQPAAPVFAVPVDDRIDPLRLVFLDDVGEELETIDLTGLPPSRVETEPG